MIPPYCANTLAFNLPICFESAPIIPHTPIRFHLRRVVNGPGHKGWIWGQMNVKINMICMSQFFFLFSSFLLEYVLFDCISLLLLEPNTTCVARFTPPAWKIFNSRLIAFLIPGSSSFSSSSSPSQAP